jgi:thioredoxin-like negative regulator of GroEL
MVKRVDSKELDRLVREERRPAVVLFFGDWCGDCRNFKPIWDSWIRDRKDSLFTVEVLRGGPEWKEWSLDEIPTVAVFLDGAEAGRVCGNITLGDLDSLRKH